MTGQQRRFAEGVAIGPAAAGICFLREALEGAVEGIGDGEKGGCLLRMAEGFYGNFTGKSMPNSNKQAVPLKLFEQDL
ncbi:MAG: hypothetical protein ACI9UA_004721, partial [Pseudoalteromonas tetraodonis]